MTVMTYRPGGVRLRPPGGGSTWWARADVLRLARSGELEQVRGEWVLC